jgi:hypothetical protein
MTGVQPVANQWQYVSSEGALLRRDAQYRLEIYRSSGAWEPYSDYQDFFMGTPLDDAGVEKAQLFVKLAAERRGMQ